MRDYSNNASSPKYGGTDQVSETPRRELEHKAISVKVQLKNNPDNRLDFLALNSDSQTEEGESAYQTNDARRQIGPISAIFLIFNRMIGTGIFSTQVPLLHFPDLLG
ncbi:amino acid permease [Botrytis cinerea]